MNSLKFIMASLLLMASLILFSCSADKEKTPERKQDKVKKISVQTVEIKSERFSDFVSVVGAVKPYKKALISTTEGGKIIKVNKEKGNFVRKGETILEIDNDIIKANLDAIKAQYKLAKITFQKQETIYKQNVNSEIQYLQSKYGLEQLEANLKMIQTRYNNTFIVAPFSGYIDNNFFDEGELAPVGQPIINLIDISRVKIKAGIPEKYITSINKGDKATIFLKALNKSFTGKISFVGTSVNAVNRTFPIEITIANNSKELKPELIAEVKIHTKTYDNTIIIPTEVLTRVDDGYIVYVNNKGKAESRKITILKRAGNNIAISDGLNNGDKLIVVGYQNLINGQAIEVVKN